MTKTWWALLALGCLAAPMMKEDSRHNAMRLPSFRGIAEVRSSLPGRIRLYMPAIDQNPAMAENMKTQLEGTGAIHQVILNPRTCTALITYDETQVEAAVVQGAAMKLMALDQQLNHAPVSKMETGMRTLYDAVNNGVMNATNGILDVRMLAGSALTIAGVRGLIRGGAVGPGAVTLLWWASGLFGRSING